jgi:hypothetical protein
MAISASHCFAALQLHGDQRIPLLQPVEVDLDQVGVHLGHAVSDHARAGLGIFVGIKVITADHENRHGARHRQQEQTDVKHERGQHAGRAPPVVFVRPRATAPSARTSIVLHSCPGPQPLLKSRDKRLLAR